MSKRYIEQLWVLWLFGALLLFWGVLAPSIFAGFYAGQLKQSVPIDNARAILDDAITINGVIAGFVLLLFFRDAGTYMEKRIPFRNETFWAVVADSGMLFLTLREIYREMFSIANLPADPTFLNVLDSLFIPWRFGIYIVFRVLIIILSLPRHGETDVDDEKNRD